MNQIIERVVTVFFPRAIRVQLDEPLQADVADAGSHATGLHGQAAALRIAAFDAWEAGDAFLRGARRATIERFLVGAGFHALAVATATLLVH